MIWISFEPEDKVDAIRSLDEFDVTYHDVIELSALVDEMKFDLLMANKNKFTVEQFEAFIQSCK